MTQPISAQQAQTWGLVDACAKRSDSLLRKHLLRLSRLSKASIRRYKKYIRDLNDSTALFKSLAVAASREVLLDRRNLEADPCAMEKKDCFPGRIDAMTDSVVDLQEVEIRNRLIENARPGSQEYLLPRIGSGFGRSIRI